MRQTSFSFKMFSTKFNLVGVIIVTLYSSLGVAGDDLRYGEKCQYQNETLVCNKFLSLYCNGTETVKDGVCRCSENMYWDSNRLVERNPGSCVSKVNHTCDSQPFDGSPKVECVRNARCQKVSTGQSKCICIRGYQPTRDGDCLATFGGPCTDDSACSYDAFLKCDKGTCVCDLEDSKTQSWDSVQKQCLSLVGATCQPTEPDIRSCIPNAQCNNATKTCECKSDFALNSQGRCVIPRKGECDNSADCDLTLTCIQSTPTTLAPTTTPSTPSPATEVKIGGSDQDRFTKTQGRVPRNVDRGHCDCVSNAEVYNLTMKQCQVLEGQSCQGTKQCVEHATCSQGLCVCSASYLSTGNGTCSGGYGAPCQVNGTDCHVNGFFSCSSGGTCDCTQGYEYNINTGKCVGFVGSTCKSDENCNGTMGSTNCDPKSMTCECKTGFSPYPTKPALQYCLGSIQANCSTPSDCNPAEFLQCKNGKCECEPESQMYDSEGRKCVGMAGAKCGGNEQGGLKCIQNAVCDVNEGGQGLCNCDKGFRRTEKNLCESGASRRDFAVTSIIIACILTVKSLL